MLKVLKKRSQFSAIKNNGSRFFSGRWLIINYLPDPEPNPFIDDSEGLLVGWTVSRKVGNAIVRNKIKRWCREYFRNYIKKNPDKLSAHVNIVVRQVDKDFYKSIRHKQFIQILDKGWTEVVKKIECC